MQSPAGASAAILRAARQGKVTLLLSVALALEYEAALAEPVQVHFLWRPQLRDPSDEMVLEAAVNGSADALVTFNVQHFRAAKAAFGIEVLVPREAVGKVKA